MSEPPPPPEIENAEQGTTTPAGQSIDDGKGRTFPCEGCGADLKFNIGQQRLKCPFCGFEKDLESADDADVAEQDFHAMLARTREWRDKDRPDDADVDGNTNEIHCESCNGTVVFVGSLTSSECPYCGSPIQRDKVHTAEDRVPVDGVLPFFVEKKVASENLRKWVKSRWFAPNEFLKRGVQGKFNGVYLPYWTFDSMTFTRYIGQRGEHYWVTVGSGDKKRRERRTRWYPASGSFQKFFDDVLVPAVKRMNAKIIRALEPWPLTKCVPFTQQVLAGYFARTYEVELDAGFDEGKERMDAALDRMVRNRIGGDEQRVHSVRTRFDALTFKHLLLPAWLLAYRFKEKTYGVMVNAATGEVQGERPYSWVKILFTVLTALAAVGVVFALSNR